MCRLVCGGRRPGLKAGRIDGNLERPYWAAASLIGQLGRTRARTVSQRKSRRANGPETFSQCANLSDADGSDKHPKDNSEVARPQQRGPSDASPGNMQLV